MSVTQFLQTLKQGGARGNQFRVTLTFPAVASGGLIAATKSQFLCDSASLPGQNVGITSMMYRGRQVKLAGERTFDNWEVQCVNDGDFSIHNAFESWMQAVNNKRDNTGLLDVAAYTVTMQVEQLDRNDNTLKMYQFIEAFPVNISPIRLDFSDNDTIERFTVSFAYQSFDATAFTAGVATLSTNAGNL